MRGRPLAFMGAVVAGWLGARTAVLWPTVEAVSRMVATRHNLGPRLAHRSPAVLPIALAAVPKSPQRRPAGSKLLTDAQIIALFGLHYFVEARPWPIESDFRLAPPRPLAPGSASAAAVLSAHPHPGSRWSLSAWLIARPGGGAPAAAPLLGASQAGARLSYAIDDRRRLAAFGRVSAPLASGPAEAALGMQWRPAAPPVTAFVEARTRPGGGIAPAAGVFGGLDTDLPGEFRLEGYGQAGWVGGRAATGFADAQVRAARVVATVGGVRLDLGGGAWGAVQRGAGRVDVGPTLGLGVPVRAGAARLAVDWRFRIAGDAAPGSGPALTLAAGF